MSADSSLVRYDAMCQAIAACQAYYRQARNKDAERQAVWGDLDRLRESFAGCSPGEIEFGGRDDASA